VPCSFVPFLLVQLRSSKMALPNNSSPLPKRDSKSFMPWSASFPPNSENSGYQQFDHGSSMETREYQQELENRQQQAHADKKAEATVSIAELQQDHSSRTKHPQYPLLNKPSGWAIFWGEWWMESIACVLVIGSLAAIVGIIWYHNGQPLPNWKHGVTINSLMSIFLVILKSGMGLVLAQGLAHLKWTWFDNARPLEDLETYDKAAHGPLGAAMLLLTVRNRHMITAVGAVVTIAALGIDPMVQGLVKYYDCSWPVSGLNATIPHSQTFSEGGKHAAAGLSQLSLPQQAAISSGLYTPGQLAMTFDCPSGNCTFSGDYSSIAYCTSCTDISDRVVMRNHTECVDRYDGTTDPTTGLNCTDANFTTTSLPSGLSNGNDANSSYLTMGSPAYDGTVVVLVGTPPTNLFYEPTGCKSANPPNSWACKGYGAISCSLQPCVQTYRGEIAGGKLTEKRIATHIDWSSGTGVSPYSAMIDMTCVNHTEKIELAKLGYEFDNSTLFLAYNQSYDEFSGDWEPASYDPDGNPILAKHASVVPRKCIYEVSGITINSLNQYWPTLFNSSGTNQGTYGATQITMADLFWNDGLASFDHIASYFENVTQALTTHIRQLGDSTYAPATEGIVLQNMTCVRVRWEFLIFPAVLIVMMLVFFVGMALETRNRRGVQAIDHSFKSSPLALMVHGLDSEVQDKLATPVEKTGGEKGLGRSEAKKVVVRLSPTEHGLRFVRE
jgi:hypothetical protein